MKSWSNLEGFISHLLLLLFGLLGLGWALLLALLPPGLGLDFAFGLGVRLGLFAAVVIVAALRLLWRPLLIQKIEP